jgi:hypothetical protein
MRRGGEEAGCPLGDARRRGHDSGVRGGGKGASVVILNAPAGEVKDLSFLKQRSFAAAQDDRLDEGLRVNFIDFMDYCASTDPNP